MYELDAVIFQSDLSLLYIRIDIRHTSGGDRHLVLLALATEMADFESIEEMVGTEGRSGGDRVRRDGGDRVRRDGGDRVRRDGGDRVRRDGGDRVRWGGNNRRRDGSDG